MKKVKNLRKKKEGILGSDLDEHPSYGMISLSRITGRFNLFGSKIEHNNCVSLKICTAERHRDEYTEHYFTDKRLVEIYLSPAQFSNLLTQFNTTGVPCTLHYTVQDGWIESPPEHSITDEMKDDLDESLKNLKI